MHCNISFKLHIKMNSDMKARKENRGNRRRKDRRQRRRRRRRRRKKKKIVHRRACPRWPFALPHRQWMRAPDARDRRRRHSIDRINGANTSGYDRSDNVRFGSPELLSACQRGHRPTATVGALDRTGVEREQWNRRAARTHRPIWC